MKKKLLFVLFIVSILLCSCNTKTAENQRLKIYVDGVGVADTYSLISEFQKKYPNIEIEVEVLPQVKPTYDSDGMLQIDTNELAEREAVLQQHRTALMSGKSDADLYLISGGSSQYHELNGGALIQNPYDLMNTGVLADLSMLLSKIDKEDYLSGVFEAGQKDGKQYIVPLQVSVCGFVVNGDGILEFENLKNRNVQQEYLLANYGKELSNLNGLCNQVVSALSYPVVDKENNEIYIKDENYTEAFTMAKNLYSQIEAYPYNGIYFGEMISQGNTLLTSVSNPVSAYWAIYAELLRNDINANLAFVPLLNEKNGVTVEVGVFAFSPVSSKNTEEVILFLEELLGEEVQSGNTEVFSSAHYPIRKGCGQDLLKNYEIKLERVGDSAWKSLEIFEAEVSDVKFASRYDYDLLLGMSQWIAGEKDLDTVIEALYEEWCLYLDE